MEQRVFDFGSNWLDYSRRALTPERAAHARQDFARLFSGIALCDRHFLDIGYGQGLGILCAAEQGAHPVGLDLNPTCIKAFRLSAGHFPGVDPTTIPLLSGSILDGTTVDALRALAPTAGYDVVQSWGVLHHTGDMRLALANAAALVRPGGHLVIAIYNRHWSSPGWLLVKKAYNAAPQTVQRAMIGALTPIIRIAKRLVTGRPPETTDRGMDFAVDIVDWVGGYPYEYATQSEVRALAEPHGLTQLRTALPAVPTGCNEFVFRKNCA